MIDNERIAELDSDAAGIMERGRADRCGDTRSERIVEIHRHESLVREDIGERSGDGDAARAREQATRIEGDGTPQEIIGGITVEERSNAGTLGFQMGVADDDQAFFFIGDIEEAVEKMDRLLFVFRQLLAKRIHSERRG